MPVVLNDVHSRLNATEVREVVRPGSAEAVAEMIRRAAGDGLRISVAGGRHAMGGQQFGARTLNLDSTALDAIHGFDSERGLLHVGAGAMWRRIIDAAHAAQAPGPIRWGIRQKQTGADNLTLAGAISANAHGRGLTLGPMVDDIEDVTLVTPSGEVRRVSREEDRQLFSLVVGGYGLFGVITSATLRLGQRLKLRRLVDVIDIEDAMNAVYRRIGEGCLYGDFQYAIDPADDSFLRRGVFACYQPVTDDTAVSDPGPDLTRSEWLGLLRLAHTDKREAFRVYARHYLDSHGRVYWSDTMQLSTYVPSYAEFLAEALGTNTRESLMITELYVPPERIIDFMRQAREVLRATAVEDLYGTIRAIREDRTTFLPWAQGDRACVIFNLRTAHSPEGIERTQHAARRLIDAAAALGGSFFLTYHRWATREQLLACHPRLPAFLHRKRAFDPERRITSDWYEDVSARLERGCG